MATVFLAQDLKHDRKVALKVLKPELAAVLGAERFVVEIKTTASLSHPHILPLFDSGTADGFLFYVMPFIEGETLREKLNRETQLGVDDAVRITREVADALDYAHRRGVIHRDIKPENILLHDGRPMVADFGIALAVSAAAGGRMTETGLSLGTPHYMSPEQATADKEITGRSDVYSLASVLYEMLAGQPPHLGGSAQQIIMKIIAEPVAVVTTLRKSVPPNVAAALAKALEKLPADRFESARAFADALGNAGFTTVSSSSRPTSPSALRRVVWIPSAVAVLALVTAAIALWRPESPRAPAVFPLDLPDSIRLANTTASRIALSRDGARLAVVAGARTSSQAIYIRSLDDSLLRLVRGTEDARAPAFSPDGSWLLFVTRDNKLMRIPATGGSAILVADRAGTASWSDKDEIIFSRGGTIWRSPAAGGAASVVAEPDSLREVGWLAFPQPLPGGESALVIAFAERGTTGTGQVAVLSLSSGKLTLLGLSGTAARYSSTGHVLFSRDGSVWAAPFSIRRKRTTGPAVLVLPQTGSRAGGNELAVAENGTLAFIAGARGSLTRLVAVDRDGGERLLSDEERYFGWVRASPDGKRIAVEIGDGVGTFDVWLFESSMRTLSRLTTGFTGIRPLGWSLDGRRIAYLAVQQSLNDQRVPTWILWDQSAPPTVIWSDSAVSPEDASIDEKRGQIALRIGGYAGPPGDILLASLSAPANTGQVVASPYDDETPRLSPDGALLAYASNETGQYEVYVRAVGTSGGRLQVSSGGGSEPVWDRGGAALYYRGPGDVMLATIARTPELSVIRRESLFEDSYRHGDNKAVQYDVLPGGQLVMLKEVTATGSRPTIVLNWTGLLRKQRLEPK